MPDGVLNGLPVVEAPQKSSTAFRRRRFGDSSADASNRLLMLGREGYRRFAAVATIC